jgi:hypothetical protein
VYLLSFASNGKDKVDDHEDSIRHRTIAYSAKQQLHWHSSPTTALAGGKADNGGAATNQAIIATSRGISAKSG